MRTYRVDVVDGYQAVLGRIVETVIYTAERRCLITDPHDRDELARRSFDAGQLAEREDHESAVTSDAPVEFTDGSASVFW